MMELRGAEAASFARTVHRRYAARHHGRPAVDRIYPRPVPPQVIVHRPLRLALAPVFRIAGAGQGRTAAAPASVAPPMVLAASPVSPSQPAAAMTFRDRVVERQETVVLRRVIAREERVSMLPPASPGGPHEPAAIPAPSPQAASVSAPPVERVWRRPAVPAETETVGEGANGWGPPIGPTRRPARPELGGAELDRLTEHVMRTLDRRVAAYRERHGRR